MDDAYELVEFLPRSFGNPSDEEYVTFLWNAFESNYRDEKYQFAFLAYHMLVMSFVYFEIWQIKENLPREFGMAMVGFNKDVEGKLLSATSPFRMSEVNESTALRFLKILGCDNGKIGKYAELVKMRNASAHSNGKLSLNSAEVVDEKIDEAMRVVREIQQHSQPVVENCYRRFLLSSLDAEEREFIDPGDQVQEVLVYANYLSSKDIEICAEFDLQSLNQESDIDMSVVEELHGNLLRLYDEIAV